MSKIVEQGFSNRWCITSVRFIKIFPKFVIFGMGGNLCIRHKNNQENIIISIFDSESVQGIISNSNSTRFVVFGGLFVKLLAYMESGKFQIIGSGTLPNWILHCQFLDNGILIAILINNMLIKLHAETLEILEKLPMTSYTLLYSAYICNNMWSDLVVLAGTVSSEVLIWGANPLSKGFKLKHHKGAIFSLDYHSKSGLIASTSDDRTANLYRVGSKVIEKELLKDSADIQLIYTFRGHEARVFRCKILSSCFLTSGEDSVIYFWSHISGALIRKVTPHSGGTICAIDSDNKLVASGSTSGSVVIFPLKNRIIRKELPPFSKLEEARSVVMISNGDILTTTRDGSLFHYHQRLHAWRIIDSRKDLHSYAILSVSECRKLISIAGFQGQMYFYIFHNDCVMPLCDYTSNFRQRIYSLIWLNCTTFLVNFAQGNVLVYELKIIKEYDSDHRRTVRGEIHSKSLFQLPHLSDHKWICAAQLLRSNCHLIVGDTRGTIYFLEYGQINPKFIIPKAHSHLGVSQISRIPEVDSSERIMSLGRDSVYRIFEIRNKTLHSVYSDKLPFTWLARTISPDLIIGFRSKEMVLWQCLKRRILIHFNCRGGHRSWDCSVLHFRPTEKCLKFVFVSHKRIASVQINLHDIMPMNLCDDFHWATINRMLPITKSLMISGGEDTIVRISEIDWTRKSLTQLFMCKHHLSSIRAICSRLSSTLDTIDVITAGGRGHLIYWTLNTKNSINLSFCCEYIEGTIRYMDVRWVGDLLIAAANDGTLTVFKVNSTNFEKCDRIIVGKCCITTICNIECITGISSIWMLCSRTDGILTLWCYSTDYPDHSKSALSDIYNYPNAICCFALSEIDKGKILVSCGGDDGGFSLIIFAVQHNVDKIKDIFSIQHNEAHCAQIVDISLRVATIGQSNKQFLYTLGLDQIVKTFKCVLGADYRTVTYEPDRVIHTTVTDLQGLVIQTTKNAESIIVYGNGFEVL